VDVLANADLPAKERSRNIDEMTAAVAALPGVRDAASTTKLPLRGDGDSFDITIEGSSEHEPSFTFFREVTRDYFATMRIALRSGRVFDISDRPDSTEIPVVINEALAARYFPSANPLGRRMGGGFELPQRVIGVVANVAEGELKSEAAPTRYYLGDQAPSLDASASIVIRTWRPADAESILERARSTVERVAPRYSVQGTTTMQRVLDDAVGPARQVMSLLALLSALALVLGGVGIYGVISHFASRRQRDWAIRVALGFPASRVVTHIIRQGVTLAILGIAIGALSAAAVTRLLAFFLFGVSGVDPMAFGAASVLLVVIGAAAAFVPGRRAGTVDPALVLREQ